MPYITPSVLVYQQLEEAGGVLNTTPDLEAVIVGPLYNNVYVDATDSISLTASESLEIVNWDDDEADVIEGDAGATGFTLNLAGTYPGQVTDASSVTVHMTDALVEVNKFEFDMTNGGTSLVTADVIAATTVDFTLPLPDATANHANVGDKVVVEYNDGSAQVIETTITAVISATQVRLADVIPQVALTTATMTVYHPYSYIQVASSQFDTTNIAQEEVNLLFTATPFPGAPAHPAGYPDYGFLSGQTHVGYSSLRTDQVQTVLTINNEDERESLLGAADENNPLSLACQLALANTTGFIKVLSVGTNDSAGFIAALDVLEGDESVYYLVPLTQSQSIITSFKNHAEQLSAPEVGLWRVVIANTDLPEILYLLGNADAPITTGVFSLSGSVLSLNDNRDFLSLSLQPGDNVVVTASDDAEAVQTFTIEAITDNQNIELVGDFSGGDITDGSTATYYISRDLSKSAQATTIASRSETWSSNRVWHIWPDSVGVDVNGVTKYLPGYYLCAAHAGAASGFPVQQGMTNIAVAGIVDLQNSNFYFSREQLGVMAEKGTCIYVQASQGGVPFCRHALTTDVSVLEYREQLKVKNWDFLSFYFKGKLSPFIGSWNITPDTISVMRQTVISSGELLVAKKLPKIGPPLLSYEIRRLEQDPNNKDQTIVEIKTEIVSPNNYSNVYLII